jgi:hypothetical protein
MAVAAFSGYVVLLVVVFGLRTVIHLRRTGTSGWLRPPNVAARAGDSFFTAGVAAVAVAPVLNLLRTAGRVNDRRSSACKRGGSRAAWRWRDRRHRRWNGVACRH